MSEMRAVIYARYSSSAQREESIEGQVKEVTAFAERNGYTIIGTYADRAISGTTDNRPEFQKMINDSKRKLFDVVIVWKLDRFARNRYDSAKYKTQLKKNGVRVISATERISEGSEGILLESVLEGMAEYFSEDLKEKVIRGLKVNAEKCVWNGGVLPIGYIVDEQRHLQLNSETAPHVLEAFTMYDEGHTAAEIIAYFKDKGITNNKGKPVTYNIIQRMLQNRRYIGEYSFQDIVIPDGIPAIVPRDLFDRVQERIAKNRKAPARAKADEAYLLSTKLFCGHCGTAMNGESGKSQNGTVHRYYKCHAVKKKLNDCKKKSVKKDWIEDMVVNETRAMLMDDDAIEAIVSTMMRMQDEESSDLPIYEKQLRETEEAIDNIVKAIMNGLASKTLQAKLTELEAEQEELKKLIAQEKLEKPKISEKFLTYWLHRFRLLDMNKEKHRQMLIDAFVNAVFVYDDKLLLTFNFKDGTRTITFKEVQAVTNNNSSDIKMVEVPKKNNPNLISVGEGFGLFLFLHKDSKGWPDRREGKKVSGGHLFSPWESPPNRWRPQGGQLVLAQVCMKAANKNPPKPRWFGRIASYMGGKSDFHGKSHTLGDLQLAADGADGAVGFQRTANQGAAFAVGDQDQRRSGNQKDIPGVQAVRICMGDGLGETLAQAEDADQMGAPDGDVESLLVLGQADGRGVGLAGVTCGKNGDHAFQLEVQAADAVGEELVGGLTDKEEPLVVCGEHTVPGAGAGGKFQGAGGGKAVFRVENADFVQLQAGNQHPASVKHDLVAAGFLCDEELADQLQPAAFGAVDQHMAVVIAGGVQQALMPGHETGGGLFTDMGVQQLGFPAGNVQQSGAAAPVIFGDGGKQAPVPGGVFGVGLTVQQHRVAEHAGFGIQAEAVGAGIFRRGIGADISF